MEYWLVLQFDLVFDLPSTGELQSLFDLQDALETVFGNLAEVDGNDVGQGKFNIFVVTETPTATFNTAKVFLDSQPMKRPYRAAYRKDGDDDYVLLWPPGLEAFEL